MDIRTIANRLKDVSDTPMQDARLLRSAFSGSVLEQAVRRRLEHEPISKIIGRRGFWKGEFIVDTNVLDPRPDSETLIEAVLSQYQDKKQKLDILDIGTGSGCLLFSLLDEYQYATGTGIDISDKALLVAGKNQNGRPAQLLCRDFLKPDWGQGIGPFDIIISNPPYIPTLDIKLLDPDVQLYDPILALDGGTDGLRAYRALAQTIPEILKKNGSLFLEIGIGQAIDVKALFVQSGLKHRHTFSDYGGIERVLFFQKS